MKRATDSIRSALTQPLLEIVNISTDVEKTRQLYEIRRSNLYYAGKQYLVARHTGDVIDWVPVGDVLTPASNEAGFELDDFDDTISNVYKGDTRKLTAVIGQKPPNVNCVAASAADNTHQRRAETADFIASHLDKSWKTTLLHMEAVYKIAVNSTVYSYTPWVVDAGKYGYEEIPRYEDQQVSIGAAPADCPSCGWMGTTEDLGDSPLCPQCMTPVEIGEELTQTIPQQVGVDRFPRGSVDCQIYSALEVTHPYWCKAISDMPWIRLDLEQDRGQLMSMFADDAELVERIRSSNFSSGYSAAYGQHVRQQVQSFSKTLLADGLNRRLQYTRYWLRPSQYGLFGDATSVVTDDVTGSALPTRDWLLSECPDGAKLCFIGDYLVAYGNESMDDVWAAGQPDAGENLSMPSYMADMLDCQDRVNDFFEQAHQSIERSLSSTIADPQVLDPKVANKIGRRAGEFIFSIPGTSGRFGDAFYKVAGSEPRPEIFAHGLNTLQFYREITGILPPIFGGGGDEATLGQAEIRRNQALMTLGVPWFYLRHFWARTYRNGIRQVVRHSPDGKLYYPKSEDIFGEGVPLPDNYKELLNGGWVCEADESMPMSAAQVKIWIERLMTEMQDPTIMMRMGVFHPDNLGRQQDVMGISGWTIPEHKQMKAVFDIIQRLSEAAPIISEMLDPMTGQPQQLPSEQPDPYLHDPAFTAQAVREWLLSDDGKKLQKTNPDGWLNVYLYGKAIHDQMQMQQLPPEAADSAAPVDAPLISEEGQQQPLLQ